MANKTRIKKNHVITSILYHLLDTGRRQVRLQRDVAHFYTLLAASSKFATGHLPHLRGGDRGGRFLSSATRSLNSPPRRRIVARPVLAYPHAISHRCNLYSSRFRTEAILAHIAFVATTRYGAKRPGLPSGTWPTLLRPPMSSPTAPTRVAFSSICDRQGLGK